MLGRSVGNKLRIGLLVVLALLSQPAWAESLFVDPLDAPALKYSSLEKQPFIGVTVAGERVIAVGSRGLIVYSDDGGVSWTQASVPVQSDLLAVNFPTSDSGWAVGHDGVILHSTDGGKTWVRQLDGRIAGEIFSAFYTAMGPDGKAWLAEIFLNYKDGPTLPWLGVWFNNERVGYVTGSYGLIAATLDGGKTWEPWLHRIDNEAALNLNSIRGIDGDIYIAGERGHVFKLDRSRGYFTSFDTGYLGSFFGIVGIDGSLLAYGLRGTVFRSDDGGANWQRMRLPTGQTITAGIAGPGNSGGLLLDDTGQLIQIDLKASKARLLQESANLRATGIAWAGTGEIVVTGIDGIKRMGLVRDAARTAPAPN